MVTPIRPKRDTINITHYTYRQLIELAWNKHLIPVLVTKHSCSQFLQECFGFDVFQQTMKTDIARHKSKVYPLDPSDFIDTQGKDVVVVDGVEELNCMVLDRMIKSAHQQNPRILFVINKEEDMEGMAYLTSHSKTILLNSIIK
ncbi:hypothetical protein [Photobacterium damselae]|uniref:Uncharacterized protein n=1 Tax=Photobacterium damselae subsp. damselae TaxID=85581 RepID=E4WL79_PHODD|nr:hypothetical protein [Photobacterium damselae]KAB1176909.1 hypothetical protein F6477_16360 [Photobacterium damselae subsp. damselae]KAB1180888.1 hypothetical protein F6450_09995 [Photobacterium damselae subsp. damselae]MBF7101090.1 hypothetical protein [Photobacterium damselae]NVO72857.1 hypothetical protein [Photobacterium damselae subsp. damselae]PSB79788.1 hypothetical protein C5F64_19760 [Photobacterium damselae subsp. damselae]